MKAAELLEELNILDEHHAIEAKRGGDVSRAVLETVCAFANEPGLGGGWIILGIERDDSTLFPAYEAVGVADPDTLSQNIATQCASVFNQPLRPSVQTEMLGGKPVIVVHVPEADAASKPIYFKSKGLPRGAFRRIGSTDQHCGDDDMLVLYAGRSGETHDRAIVSGATLADIDPDALDFYRTARGRVNAAAEELSWSDKELLTALNAVREEGDQLFPTLGGILLFGTRQAQRRLLPMMRVDYIRVPGNQWVENPADRFATTDMRGPLLSLVQRAQDSVIDDLPRGFILPEGAVQAETPRLSSRVLREAIVNAVMHRSYQVQGAIQIIRYNNRIEISNPGYSLKAEERLGDPGSETRNPHLAAVFHETNFAETNFAETKGSGIRTMRRLMGEAGFAPPTFESDRTGNRFVTRLLLHHFLNDADLRWLSGFAPLKLTDGERRALVFLREAGAIDNATCRQINATDTLTASADLRRLRQADLIDMRGKGSATYYLPTDQFLATLSQGQSKDCTDEQESAALGQESAALGQESAALGQESAALGQESAALKQEFPASLRQELESLGKRIAPTTLRTLIQQLCAARPLSTDQLASLLTRAPATLRRKHLNVMLEEGTLRYTHPDMLNHPRQAYTGTPMEEKPSEAGKEVTE